MHETEEKRIAELLKQSLTPLKAELDRDLWPRMLQRLDRHQQTQSWFATLLSTSRLSLVPWFDWVLLGVMLVGVCAFPKSIPIWLYHI